MRSVSFCFQSLCLAKHLLALVVSISASNSITWCARCFITQKHLQSWYRKLSQANFTSQLRVESESIFSVKKSLQCHCLLFSSSDVTDVKAASMRTPGGAAVCVPLSAHHTWTTSEAAGRSSWDALFIRSGLILLATALYSWNIHLLSWLVLSTLTCGPPAEEKPYFQAEVGGVIKKTYSCVKLLNADVSVVLQSSFSAAAMCFSPGTSGVTCVTTNLPGPPDAIQMPHPETHTGLFVCSTWGLVRFFPHKVGHALTRMQMHARLH